MTSVEKILEMLQRAGAARLPKTYKPVTIHYPGSPHK